MTRSLENMPEGAAEVLDMLSYELRQPLAAIAAALEVQKRSVSPERRARAEEICAEQLTGLTRAVDRLSDLAALSRGVSAGVDRCDIGCLVREAVRSVLPAIRARRVAFSLRIAPAPVIAEGDAGQLRRAFTILLENACACSPNGCGVDVTLEPHAGGVRLTVVDRGSESPRRNWRDSSISADGDAARRRASASPTSAPSWRSTAGGSRRAATGGAVRSS